MQYKLEDRDNHLGNDQRTCDYARIESSVASLQDYDPFNIEPIQKHTDGMTAT